MLRVSLSQVVRTENGDVPRLLAQLRVDANGIDAEDGERTKEVLQIPVLDPETGKQIKSHEDPVRWARLLPLAIRSGDLVVFVEDAEAKISRTENAGHMADLAEELAEVRQAAIAG
jgi:hypothetical protein